MGYSSYKLPGQPIPRGVEIGIRLERTWPERIPTAGEVVAQFRCSQATAYRYIRAMKNIRGIE